MYLINANILTMSGEPIANGFVELEGGLIKTVGDMKSFPGGESIDLGGKYLLPGFIDAHSHLGMCEDGVGFEGEDINECSEPISPQLRASDSLNLLDRTIAEAREAGVTCVVASPGSANPIGGQLCAFKTIGCRLEDAVIAEPLAVKLAFGENPKRVYGEKDHTPMSRMASVALIREALIKAQRYMRALERADEPEDEPEYDFRCEALLPLLRREIPAHIHAHRAFDILSAIRLAKEFELEYVLVHATEGHLIADILAEEKAKIICGPIVGTRSKPELSQMEARNTSVLIKHGLTPAICTDHPEIPANYLLNSASIAAAEGIDDHTGLLTITLWAARTVGLEARIGSIEPGKDADLVVFAEHPLHTFRKPELVFIGGEQIGAK